MRIDPTTSRPTNPPPPPEGPASARTSENSAVDRGNSSRSEYLPSNELLRLTTLASLEPEVRLTRVQEVAERLRQGYYAAPQRGAEVAEAIVRAAD